MKTIAGVMLIAFLLVGCSSSQAVRQLSVAEKQAFDSLSVRLDNNRQFMEKALGALSELGAAYTESASELEQALSKAKLLESMQSTLANTSDEFVETQRAVILYHLYEMDLAEQKMLESRVAEREAACAEVQDAYDQLNDLLAGATDNLEVIIRYMNQPKKARIKELTANFLGEVNAFRMQLAGEENPLLNKLANDVARYEARVNVSRARAEAALNLINAVKGN